MTKMTDLTNGPNGRRGDARPSQEDGRGTNLDDRPKHFGIALCAALVLAAFCRWLSNLTTGDEYGGWYDLGGVSHVSWFAFLLFAAAAVMVAVAAVLRMVDEARGRMGRRRIQESKYGDRTKRQAPGRALSLMPQDPAIVVARCGGQQRLLPDRPVGVNDESLAASGAAAPVARTPPLGVWSLRGEARRQLSGPAPPPGRGERRRPRAFRLRVSALTHKTTPRDASDRMGSSSTAERS